MKRPAGSLGAELSAWELELLALGLELLALGLVNRNRAKNYRKLDCIPALYLVVMVDRPQCHKASKQARPSLFAQLTVCPVR